MSIVVLAAAPFEWQPVCTEIERRNLSCQGASVGIGPLEAARNSRQLAQTVAGCHVVFVGSCGVFGPFVDVSLITSHKVIWSPTCERLGCGYQPSAIATTYETKASPPWIKSLSNGIVLCSPTISIKADLPKELEGEPCYENMELFSCIDEIERTCASLAIVLGVTNGVGKNAHEQWQRNHLKASQMVAKFVGENAQHIEDGRN